MSPHDQYLDGSQSLINCTNLSKVQGLKVTRIKSGPSRVEIKVVSQGDELN